MFTFTFAFFAAIDIFLFIFKLFPKVEEGIWKKAFTTKTKFDRLACFAAHFSSFPKENAVLKKTYEL